MKTRAHAGGVIVSHSGRQHSYRVASSLQAAGLLDIFYTSTYYKRERFPDRLARLVPALDRWLQKRSEPSLDPDKVRRFPMLELPEIAYRSVRGNDRNVTALVDRRDVRFDALIAKRLQGRDAQVFWGFQGSCLESLRAARDAQMIGVLELASVPAPVVAALLERDHAQRGDASGPQATSAHTDAYRRRAEKEPLEADLCIVASTFAAHSVQSTGIAREKIRIIPLGVDVRKFAYGERKKQTGPLKVLFVGKLGRHKGLGYLLAAMKRVGGDVATLSLAGPSVGEDLLEGSSNDSIRRLGALDGADLVRAYAEHDVLVLPSLYEGFGLVVVEAMACGTPVIASENSCGPDVVREGVDGFVIPPFSADAIAERIDWFAAHRPSIGEMGRNAASRAQEFSWDHHAARVAAFARDAIDERRGVASP